MSQNRKKSVTGVVWLPIIFPRFLGRFVGLSELAPVKDFYLAKPWRKCLMAD